MHLNETKATVVQANFETEQDLWANNIFRAKATKNNGNEFAQFGDKLSIYWKQLIVVDRSKIAAEGHRPQ